MSYLNVIPWEISSYCVGSNSCRLLVRLLYKIIISNKLISLPIIKFGHFKNFSHAYVFKLLNKCIHEFETNLY